MATGGLVAGLVALGGTAGADAHWETLADDLANPRGVALGPGGRVYVAQAGAGGDDAVVVETEGETGELETVTVCVGTTGTITEFGKQGRHDLIDLPSIYFSEDEGECDGPGLEVIGPHAVDATGRGELSIAIGLGGSTANRAEVAAENGVAGLLGTAHRILPNGKNKPLGDLAAFEDSNPDGQEVDSNPYGIAVLPDGSRLVADAGGNSLVRVAEGADPSLVAVFTPVCMPSPFGPIPGPCGGDFPASAVPTSVDVGPDGDIYVGLLGGFPFEPGTSPVYRIDADHMGPAVCSSLPGVPSQGCEVYASGLTSIVDIEFGPDGTLYAVQFADGGVFAGFGGGPGSVQAVPWGGGAATPVVQGLSTPGGVAAAHDALYVTNKSISATDGELLRIPMP